MQNAKKSKKNSIEKLRNVLDNISSKDIPPEDERFLRALRIRLGESSKREAIYSKITSKESNEEVDSMKPKVTIYPRAEKKIVEFTEVDEKVEPEEVTSPEIIEDIKGISYEKEDLIEVEKVKVEGPEFVEVKPKEEVKQKIEDKNTLTDEKITEWEPVDSEKKVKEGTKTTEEKEFVPVFVPVKKSEEKAPEFEPITAGETAKGEMTKEQIEETREDIIDRDAKIGIFKDFESIDEETAVLLYDNGFTTTNYLMKTTLKDLTKIKGIKKKTAKNIKKEIDKKIEESAKVKSIDTGETATNGKISEEQIEDDEIVEKEELIPSPVELTAGTAEWEPATEDEAGKQDKSAEEISLDHKSKIETFKDFESIDDKTAVLLYDNGFTTVETITTATLKDLTKIKGIKRKKAKEIKREIEQKHEWIPEPEEHFIDEEIPEMGEATEIDKRISGFKPEAIPEEEKFEDEEVEDMHSMASDGEDAFKDIKSIDEKIANLLKNNGIDSIDALRSKTIKDLTKIKGIKKKIAKEIKKEVNELTDKEETTEEESFERGKNPFVEEDEEDEWDSFDDEKISDWKMKEIKGFRHGDYTLFEKEIDTESGKKKIVRFFSKAQPEDGEPIELPKGYEVMENKKTGVPYLKKKK